MSSTKIDKPIANKANRLRVLIADDVQATRRSTRLMMSLIPNVEVVAIANNGREAVELAHKHNVHIALLDIKMPIMDGLQATQKMLQRNPDIVCALISAERSSDTLLQAMAAGASEYLIKPFTSDELVTIMGRMTHDVKSKQLRWVKARQLRKERDNFMIELAKEYMKSRRTDQKAQEVFETLAENPYCDVRWLRNLAIIYIVREQWGKLKTLASRLEKQTQVSAQDSSVVV